MLQLSDIKNLPVYTKTGRYLGRVVDIEIDPQSQLILCYQVGRWPSVSGLWRGRLLINREQVISVSKSAMVVEETSLASKIEPEVTPVVS